MRMDSAVSPGPASAAEAGKPAPHASIAGLGMAVPERVIKNAPIAEHLGVDADWISTRTGIVERHHASDDETLEDLAAAAGRAALERAGIGAEDLDQVLVATFTASRVLPNAAPVVAAALGTRRPGAVDVGAACTGWLSGLAFAAAQVEAGRAEAVLVIGADLCSRPLDHDDRRTAGLFGDGAGAVVVTAGGPGRVGRILLRSEGSEGESITAERKGLIEMRGQDTFRSAVEHLCESTLELLAVEELAIEDIDVYAYHQANSRIISAVGKKLGLPTERVIDCIEGYGNTSAASIPIALCEAERSGLLRPGARVLVSAIGAGLAWGSGIIEWGI